MDLIGNYDEWYDSIRKNVAQDRPMQFSQTKVPIRGYKSCQLQLSEILTCSFWPIKMAPWTVTGDTGDTGDRMILPPWILLRGGAECWAGGVMLVALCIPVRWDGE